MVLWGSEVFEDVFVGISKLQGIDPKPLTLGSVEGLGLRALNSRP